MKTEKLILLAKVARKQDIEEYTSKTDGRVRYTYPIVIDDGKNFSDVNVAKEIYDVVVEGRKYAFHCAFNNEGRFPDTSVRIVGLSIPESLPDNDDFTIIPASDYVKLTSGKTEKPVK